MGNGIINLAGFVGQHVFGFAFSVHSRCLIDILGVSFSDNVKEIVFWGEEGAIATPPRLARIAKQLEGEPDGWDGATDLEEK